VAIFLAGRPPNDGTLWLSAVGDRTNTNSGRLPNDDRSPKLSKVLAGC
jgi:hypothetical protein